ncbi:hypothetical protein N7497_012203 [Penicillium chrysogenum]|nr:hypothetical protein N7497_012203 [Penicillium chrysogenum]
MSRASHANECERNCPGSDEQEAEPTSGGRAHHGLNLESQVASLHSQSVFHDGESETIAPTLWFVHY